MNSNKNVLIGLIILVVVFLTIGSITTVGTDVNVARFLNITNGAGSVIGSYVDGVACLGSYCVYKPWYSPSSVYAKNGSSGLIEASGTDISTVINSVLAVAPAQSTIKVNCGTYTTNTRVSNTKINIAIIGDSPQCVTIRQTVNSSNHELFYDAGSGNTYSGMHLIGAGNASNLITIYGDNFTVNNNIIEGGQYGVQALGGSDEKYISYISNNEFYNFTEPFGGIYLYFINNVSVVDNTIINQGYRGITLTNTNDSIVEGNKISGNSIYGIQVFYSDGNKILNNVVLGIKGSSVASENATSITLDRSDRNLVMANDFTNGFIGIYMEDAWSNTILSNNIKNMSYYGTEFTKCGGGADRQGRGTYLNVVSGNMYTNAKEVLFPTEVCAGQTQASMGNNSFGYNFNTTNKHMEIAGGLAYVSNGILVLNNSANSYSSGGEKFELSVGRGVFLGADDQYQIGIARNISEYNTNATFLGMNTLGGLIISNGDGTQKMSMSRGGDVRVVNLSGGAGYVCVDTNGQIYRNAGACP